MLSKYDILVNFAAVSSGGADRNNNFAEQLQDTVNLIELKIFQKKKKFWIQLRSNPVLRLTNVPGDPAFKLVFQTLNSLLQREKIC